MRRTPTEAEKRLWWHLRESFGPAHFRRQVIVGGYIADFASHGAKLIIELDGGQHAEQVRQDTERTRVLNANGYRVVRFWNNDVLENIEGVLESIRIALTTSTPTPDPSPQGGGESAHREARSSTINDC